MRLHGLLRYLIDRQQVRCLQGARALLHFVGAALRHCRGREDRPLRWVNKPLRCLRSGQVEGLLPRRPHLLRDDLHEHQEPGIRERRDFYDLPLLDAHLHFDRGLRVLGEAFTLRPKLVISGDAFTRCHGLRVDGRFIYSAGLHVLWTVVRHLLLRPDLSEAYYFYRQNGEQLGPRALLQFISFFAVVLHGFRRTRGHPERGHGRFDGYWEWELNYWDVAAGMVIIKEAGGYVEFIEPSLTTSNKRNIIATNSNIQDELKGLLIKKNIE